MLDGPSIQFTLDVGYLVGVVVVAFLGWFVKRGVDQLDAINKKQETTNLHLVKLDGRLEHVEENLDRHIEDDERKFSTLFNWKNSQSP